jgi:hypothetical protein
MAECANTPFHDDINNTASVLTNNSSFVISEIDNTAMLNHEQYNSPVIPHSDNTAMLCNEHGNSPVITDIISNAMVI